MSNQNQPYGIDISSYQYSQDGKQKPDFAKLNSKCAFVAVRAGISWGYTDRWFAHSWANITRPKMAYHVLYPGEDAGRQMDHFLSIVMPTEHDRLVLDLELDHGYSKSKITQTLLVCLNILRGSTGQYPIVYSRASWVDKFVDVSLLPDLDWWLAHYLKANPPPAYTPEMTKPPALPKGITNWFIHQTGEKGNGSNAGVVSHYVDTNRWNGTEAELLAYFGLTEEVPVPEPEPPDEVLFRARVYSWATPYVNIRKEPSITSQDLGDLYPNVVVNVLGIYGDWYKINEGYVMAKYLEPIDTLPIVIEPEKPLYQAVVTTVPPNRLRVRRTPNGEFVRWLQSGDKVDVYQETNGWLRVGVGEWSSADYLQRVFDSPNLLSVPLYSQRDPRWANDKMGSSNITMGQQGCLATVTSSGLTFLGYPIDPKEYNKQASAKGGYQYPNLMYWQFPDVLTGGKIIRAEYSGWHANGKGWETQANAILSSGRPVWAHVDFNRETSAIEQHWVLIIGKDQYGYWVYDPWIGATANLTARYDGLVFRVVSYKKVK